MTHLKRNSVPRVWPIERKGTTFIALPLHGMKNSIPVLVILRDILGLASKRKEAEQIIHMKKVKINGEIIHEDKFPVTLFDVVDLDGKNYRLVYNQRKYGVQEIAEKEAHSKIAKVTGKSMVKGKKLQLNLNDGRNYLSTHKAKINDSAIVNFKEKKISEILELKKGAKIIFITGKHIGETGKIDHVEGEKIIIELANEKINGTSKSIMVVK